MHLQCCLLQRQYAGTQLCRAVCPSIAKLVSNTTSIVVLLWPHLCGWLHVSLDALGLVVHCICHAAADCHTALLGLQAKRQEERAVSSCCKRAFLPGSRRRAGQAAGSIEFSMRCCNGFVYS
jgi:hypothetical protein